MDVEAAIVTADRKTTEFSAISVQLQRETIFLERRKNSQPPAMRMHRALFGRLREGLLCGDNSTGARRSQD